jgi:uncharacterized protein (TIGR02145 family)/uncharacterized repeat protein (TIGR02543 family)/prepilin-type N-terminal cleavage/methylation domain-containing protein
MFKFNLSRKKSSGMTLVEVLVGSAIFVILALSVYQGYKLAMDVIRVSRIKVAATALANEQFEIMRNMPYTDVGILGGLPPGKVPYTQTLVRDDKEFVVKTTIRNIDDPFDGELGGMVNDTSPADYKLAELEITCALCRNFPPINVTTYIGPKNLESASTNGALFVKVFDANGVPLPGVSVHVENNSVVPSFVVDDETNSDGLLQIVDAPPGVRVYEITVSKDGYTTEQTYPVGGVANPDPVKPHATVSLQQLTQISFFIDKASTLQVSSVSDICFEVPSFNFSLRGEKLIGTGVYKFSDSFITDSNGEETTTGLDWDTYKLTTTDEEYDLAGVIPASTFTLSPDAVQTLKLILSPKNPQSLLVTVKDISTGLPLSDVTANLVGTEYDTTLMTGRGFMRQTDWAGGAGQEVFYDPARYFDSDGNADISSFGGTIQLKNTLGEYATSTWLVSSTFDTGSASNFHKISWQPQDQPAEAGADSVRFQVATNNGSEVWDFTGPDGTADTYYTVASQEINSDHDGDRYLRYKVFLQTADLTKTPTVSDVSFTFTSDCVPPGQVFFTALLPGSYTLALAKAGFEPVSQVININSPWQEKEITFTPSEYTPVSTYAVTYSGNNNTRGFAPTDNNVYEAGDVVTVLDNTDDLARTGYYFSGWNVSPDGSGTSRATSSTFIIGSASVNLYAKWIGLNYTISFSANGGIGTVAPQTLAVGETVNLNANTFTRDGYYFSGWATSSLGAVVYSDTESYTMGASNATLYAKWNDIPVNHTITFDANGGTGIISPQTILAGSSANLTLNSFARTGYTFMGWATTPAGTISYTNGGSYTMGDVDVTLYAVWLRNCSGTMTDSRDSKIYSIAFIGSQCWMTQNLNVGSYVAGSKTQSGNCPNNIKKYCYGNDSTNCIANGGLYQWNQAMCGGTTAGAKGICPVGWHIPTHDEYTALERAVCTSGTCATDFPYDVTTVGARGTDEGTTLKSLTGLFKGLLSGNHPAGGAFGYLNINGFWWTSSQITTENAWIRSVDSSLSKVTRANDYAKTYGLSVRCVRD